MLDVLLLLFGVVMLMTGWRSLGEYRRLQAEGVEALATITDVEEFIGPRKKTYYRPVWTFTDANGNEHRIPGTHGHSTIRSSYTVGETKEVIYDRQSPETGAYEKSSRAQSAIAIYPLIGVAAIVFATLRITGVL